MALPAYVPQPITAMAAQPKAFRGARREPRLELLDGLARGGLGVTVLEVFEDLLDAVHLLLQVHDEPGDPGDVGADGELEILEVLLGVTLEDLVEAGVAL